jgi:hypothetical protein
LAAQGAHEFHRYAAQVTEQIAAYGEAGVTHCAALVFPGQSIQETMDQMTWFASDVVSQFRS